MKTILLAAIVVAFSTVAVAEEATEQKATTEAENQAVQPAPVAEPASK